MNLHWAELPKPKSLLPIFLFLLVMTGAVVAPWVSLTPAALAQTQSDRKAEADRLLQQGSQQFQTSQYREALQSLQRSLEIYRNVKDRNGEASSLLGLGNAYKSLGQYPRAIEYYQQSLAIFKDIGDREGEGLGLSDLGHLLSQKNQPQLAIIFYKQSVNVREAIRKDLRVLSPKLQQSYTETVADSYRRLADLLLQQDRVLKAQQVLDLLKIQELDDYLRNVRGNNQTAQGIDNLPPEQQILNKYGELQKSAIQIGKELTDLRKTPEERSNPLQQMRIAQLVKIQSEIDQQFNQFIDSKDIQALVGQLNQTAKRQSLDLGELAALKDDLRKAGNAVLLYPLILDDRLELILTTPDTPPIRRTVAVKREELNRTIVEFRSALTNPNSDAKIPAQKLYNWLIKPLEADLKQAGSQTIIYAPDGQLRYIPLAALFDGKQWLVERYRINNITAKSLTNFNIKPQTQPKVLAGAFASGRYSFSVGKTPYTFDGLLGARKEVQMLTASFPSTATLIDLKFSKDATTTKMNEYAIVHLATHAAFVVGDSSNSFVLFGTGERASLIDIRNWDLTNVDLVVLSACETGLGGQFGNGEEVLGLGYVFQEKGARAILASLWTVDDNGTQALMTDFYNEQPNRSKLRGI
jgi:CHAT domain-containing protein